VAAIRAGGSFGLGVYGFGGGLSATRQATLSATARVQSGGGCTTKLRWRLHPALRRSVSDGTWKLHFSDGESETFRVQSGGRLATSIRLPTELARCGGPFGAVDLFIGPTGKATISQPKLNMLIDFSRRSATGQITVPGGCAHPHFPLRATR
jgi:hypothetical protein